MATTYRRLLEALKELDDQQLDNDIAIYISWKDEFYPLVRYALYGNEFSLLTADTK